jgi:thiamine transport system permease protein
VLALVQLVIVVGVIGVVRRLSGHEQGLSHLAAVPPTAVAHRQRLFAFGVAGVTATFVLLPIAALLWRSVQVGDTLSLAAWRTIFDTSLAASIRASIRTALFAGALGVALAVLTTLAIVRLNTIGRLVDLLSIVVLAVSPVTLGLGLMLTFDIGWFDWRAKWWFVALAHTLVAFPLAVRVLVPAWRTTPIGLHQAAAVLGAGELRRLVDIDLRRMRPAIVASLGLIIAVSLGEFGAASLMSRADGETMPVMIARLLSRTGDLVRAQAFVLASLLVAVCIAALVLVESALGRSDRVARR